jgi:hypothetical protein
MKVAEFSQELNFYPPSIQPSWMDACSYYDEKDES